MESGVRLISVSGRSGVGKTALLMAVVAALPTNAEVISVDLVDAADDVRLLDGIARRLGIGGAAGASTRSVDDVAAFIATRSILLVVDHADSYAVDDGMIAELLAACPALTLVVARRRPLPGAVDVDLDPLETPPEDASYDEICANESVRLFRDRAVRTSARFRLDTATAPPVAEVCRLVGGLPLAIELAAARVAVMPPDQLARRASRRQRIAGTRPRPAVASRKRISVGEACAWRWPRPSPS